MKNKDEKIKIKTVKKQNNKKQQSKFNSLLNFVDSNEDWILAISAGILLLLTLGVLFGTETKKPLDENFDINKNETHAYIEENDTKAKKTAEKTIVLKAEKNINTNININIKKEKQKIQNLVKKKNTKVFFIEGKLILINLDSSEKTEIIEDKNIIDFSLSSDKKNIAYITTNNGFQEIFILDLKTNKTKQITNTNAQKSSVVFDKSSEKIFFISNIDSVKGEIYSVDIDGSNQTRITNNNITEISIDVSGNKEIIFTAPSQENANLEIFVINKNGETKNLTNSFYNERYAKFSDDSQKIVYIKDESKSQVGEIFVMDKDGSNQKRITNNSIDERIPQFLDDGNKIIFWENNILFEANIFGNGDVKKLDIF